MKRKTVIEALIVLVILIIFTTCIGLQISGSRFRSGDRAIHGSRVRGTIAAIHEYHHQNGVLPASNSGAGGGLLEDHLLARQLRLGHPDDVMDRYANAIEMRWYHGAIGGILVSVGEDWALDIRPEHVTTLTSATATLALSHRTYDPTNGARSYGDLWHWVEVTPP